MGFHIHNHTGHHCHFCNLFLKKNFTNKKICSFFRFKIFYRKYTNFNILFSLYLQVYFPVVFSLYNPELVYRLYEKDVPSIFEQLTVGTDNGYWRYFGFGMFCMHQTEYNLVGGVPEYESWGGEDVQFYERFGDFPNIKVNICIIYLM